MKICNWILPFVAASPLVALADDELKPLAVDAEIGALVTSGNTESTSLKAKLDVKQEFTKWRTHYVADAIYQEDKVQISPTVSEEQKTAERYFASAQIDYKLNQEHRGLFVFGSYEEDKFSGFEYQGSLSAGYTDRFIKTENIEWNYSIGAGASFDKPEDLYNEDGDLVEEGEAEEFTIIRFAFDFRYDISENAKFTQTFASDIATESGYNTKSRAESAITANINDSFALRASFTIINNTEVPVTNEETDTQTALVLVYTL